MRNNITIAGGATQPHLLSHRPDVMSSPLRGDRIVRLPDSIRGYPRVKHKVETIDGRTYPIEIIQEKHWQKGLIVNFLLVLTPDPNHWTGRAATNWWSALATRCPAFIFIRRARQRSLWRVVSARPPT